ncbi:MAG: beta-ketoacyl-ACP synthase II [Gemmatimonadetes bacterium]|nr:beta-ketoacyl-ACP synthase II [Gemmatimonadota bacterium]
MKRRVVVTGLGLVTPVGNDVPTAWRAILDGASGGGPITHFNPEKHRVRFACEVKGFDPLLYMDKKEVKRSDLYTRYALAASVQAMQDAGFGDSTGYDPLEFGVIIGSGIGGIATFEEQQDICRSMGPNRVSAFFVPMFIGDIAAGVVSMRYGLKGPNYATQSACATSAHAIGDACRAIQYGDADLMLAGGSEAAVSSMAVAGFANMQALSYNNDNPLTASRPFSATRDGFVLGEGAGIVVLEELEHARKRGARIYGEIVGYGSTGDAFHLTGQPEDHEGLQRAMRKALKEAGLAPEDVQYVNAHGTSTPMNDPNEIRAIKKVFGEHARTMNVSSTKSSTGHTLGAAGAIEFVFTTLAVHHDTIPPTINLTDPDPECDLNCTPLTPVKREVRAAISNSSGFGGHNVTIAVRKYTA